MKWLLIIYVVTAQPSPDMSVERVIEIETGALCEAAKENINKTVMPGADGGLVVALSGLCIQVRE